MTSMPHEAATPDGSEAGTAGTAGGGPESAMLRFVLPSAEFLRTRAPLLAPVGLVAAVTVPTVAATVPLVRAAYAARPELLPTTMVALRAMAILSPLTALLKGLVLGGVAWSVVVLTGVVVRYRTMVSALIYAQTIIALQGAWATALLWLRGSVGVHRPSDLILATGLDAFVSDPHSALAVVARNVNPFYGAWFVFLTLLIARVARRGWWRGALAASTIWVLVTGLGFLRALAT